MHWTAWVGIVIYGTACWFGGTIYGVSEDRSSNARVLSGYVACSVFALAGILILKMQ